MRKIIVWNLSTLDGFFEGKTSWDLAFHMSAWGPDLEAFSLAQAGEVGTLLFGRKTYEGMAAYWSKEEGPIAAFMNGVEKVVASRTLDGVSWNNSRLLDGEVPAAVEALKKLPGKDIYVFGSADLVASLLENRLVDEYRLCFAPMVLGGGNPLFKPSETPLKMRLLAARPIDTGGVILNYEPLYGA